LNGHGTMKYDSLTEQSISALVDCFYAKVRRDAVLAPIFEKALAGRWDAHVAKMCEFWCSALRVKRSYHGDMLVAHRKLSKLPRSLFQRWLAPFRETVDECFMEAPAEIICDRALKTARNLASALSHGGTNPAPRMHLDGFDPTAQSARRKSDENAAPSLRYSKVGDDRSQIRLV
jgi:hemoglobin